MIENSYRITDEIFKDDMTGNALLINTHELIENYKYIGIWYARDGNENTSITTEIFISDAGLQDPEKPDNYKMEIKENSFKQFNRVILPIDKHWIWIATRIDNGEYCKMKTGPVKEGKTYINYKVVHNKGNLFDIVGSGNIKGVSENYFGVYCEDNTGTDDFNDLVMFFVALKQMPPDDWNIDHYSIGIDGLPVFTQVFKFNDNKKYSEWLGQKPEK